MGVRTKTSFNSETARKAGKLPKHTRKARIKELLEGKEIDKIEDLQLAVLNVAAEMLESPTKRDRQFALKELSKYIFPTKKEINAVLNPHDEFIRKYGSATAGGEDKAGDNQ